MAEQVRSVAGDAPGPVPTATSPGRGLRLALAEAGQVGADLLAVDWDETPLGPLDEWPQSLCTSVRILVSSRFSMWMAWGPRLTFFCNDAYRRDTLATKYPWALGRPADEVWAEIWPDIGPRIDRVMRTGVATWDEALQLFLERSGYAEETYHTFSYSPLTDDEGTVAGMLCVVSEDTDRVVGERRMRTLRDLGSATATGRTEQGLATAAAGALASNPWCLPFTLLFLHGEDGATTLAATTGVPAGHPLTDPAAWPVPPTTGPTWGAATGPDDDLDLTLDGAASSQAGGGASSEAGGGVAGTAAEGAPGTAVVRIDHLTERFDDLPTGAWAEPPVQAWLVPLVAQSGAEPYGFLVAGLNRHRPPDEGYRGFVALMAGQLAAGVAGARAYEAERRRAEALAELDRAKTTFFTNVSHELRTPLTLMLGPAEDALADEEEALPDVQRRRVEMIHRNAQRLLRLVNTLLDFSRLQAGAAVPRFELTDLAAYTADLTGTFSDAVRRAGLTLIVDCPPLPGPVLVDREMWAKIVLNLLSNALKFTLSGGIEVRLHVAEGQAVLAVTDTGTGIEGSEQAHLFERFHRVDGARGRSHEGSGIGLALVAELAALHGGGTAVTSTPGVGSSFTVTLPLRAPAPAPSGPADGSADGSTAGTAVGAAALLVPDAAAQAPGYLAEADRWLPEPRTPLEPTPAAAGPTAATASVPAGAPVPAGEVPDSDRPDVLVVDDNADMRAYLGDLLGSGYRVRTAANGVQALVAVHERLPDLILTDVMMPELDGLGLVRALRADPVTALVPVVVLSARAGPEAATDGLEAGADDYLTKPFSAGELRARVRANLELDRTRRTSEQLERSRELLDQAQRLAQVGSWELDLRSGTITASEEFARQLGVGIEQLAGSSYEQSMLRRVHPDDRRTFRDALAAAARGEGLDVEVRLVGAGGDVRTYRTIGELERHADGTTARLRGSNQDVTEQRRAEQALTIATAAREAAAREHRIADELQRSLLPTEDFTPDHLQIATYYRAGVEGTQVGGDWFDVIELGADRTALVIGDVMGRGVRAAAVMGQLRAAVRAYARLDMPPADLLEFIDALVRDLGEDQIVTCLYAVYDPGEGTLSYANAGHLPPLIAVEGSGVRRLTGAEGSPLGSGPLVLTQQQVELPVGATLVLYTDGLVEHRDRDIDSGIDQLGAALAALTTSLTDTPAALVAALVPGEPDDDIAVLAARVSPDARPTEVAARFVPSQERAVRDARQFVAAALERWQLSERVSDDIVLLVSELVTNAVVHGRPPIELRLRRTTTHVVVEVADGATFLPRKLRPTPDHEHGRGLQLVALLADRWGTRATHDGKSVWFVINTAR